MFATSPRGDTRMNTLPTLLLAVLLAAAAAPAAAQVQAAPMPAPVEQGISISAGTLDTYAGNYRIAPGLDLRVWREADGLVLQATGQAAWPLLGISETQFKVRGMDARVGFVHDAAGNVGQLVLDMDGRQTRALRR